MTHDQPRREKRFRLVKLEERVVPAHLATVVVPPAPGIELARANQPHIEFQAFKAITKAGVGGDTDVLIC